jgi:WD40 repeat protein
MVGRKRCVCRGVDAIWCLCVLLGLGGCAATAPPDRTPTPVIDTPGTEGRVSVAPIRRLDTGGHTAVVRRIDIDAKERYLVTGSDDKLVRVWSFADGALLQTLRMPATMASIRPRSRVGSEHCREWSCGDCRFR